MAPNNITLLVVPVYHFRKHLVRLLIRIKLRLETPGGCKTIFLRKTEVMKKRPQDVVAITIVILMNYLFIKENWNASLLTVKEKGSVGNLKGGNIEILLFSLCLDGNYIIKVAMV